MPFDPYKNVSYKPNVRGDYIIPITSLHPFFKESLDFGDPLGFPYQESIQLIAGPMPRFFEERSQGGKLEVGEKVGWFMVINGN